MKTLLIFAIICTSLTGYTQKQFEGRIKYNMAFTAKTSSIDIETLKKELGTHVDSYYKKGFYKEIANSSWMSYQLYRHDSIALFFKNHVQDSLVMKVSVNDEPIEDFSYSIIENADTILGNICNQLVVTDKHGTKSFYYSSNYPINPEHYKNFTNANKHEIVRLMKAIFLRLTMNYELFTVDIIAAEITPMKLKDEIFALPENAIIQAIVK